MPIDEWHIFILSFDLATCLHGWHQIREYDKTVLICCSYSLWFTQAFSAQLGAIFMTQQGANVTRMRQHWMPIQAPIARDWTCMAYQLSTKWQKYNGIDRNSAWKAGHVLATIITCIEVPILWVCQVYLWFETFFLAEAPVRPIVSKIHLAQKLMFWKVTGCMMWNRHVWVFLSSFI